LKELELTEGRATGIPTILKSLKDNGSPSPKFNTDEDRSFFEVELFIHETFAEKVPLKFNPETIQWNLESIDRLLNLLVESVLGGIAEGIAENHTYWLQITDNHIIKILARLESNQVSIIAGGIAGGIAKKMITVLEIAEISKSRKDLLLGLSLVNNANNFENYIQSLVELNWITMTIPDKPTSPNQKYLTTLKGRLVLEILRHNKK
jgi:ATP-dependent DNA helicase RecG